MKKLYVKIFTITAIIMGVITSCTKDFQSVNTDPTTVPADEVDPSLLLSNVELTYTGSTDFSYETWRANLIYCSVMMQQLSSVNGYWVGDKSRRNDAYLSAYWEKSYSEQVKPVVDLVTLTADKPEHNNLHQVARIMKAMVFHRITDLYGDVPYSEAGLGYYNQILTPKYDAQQAIYMDMLKELDEASQALVLTGGDVVKNDIIYNGNIVNWQKFANSLELRLAMRLVKADPATAQTYAAKAIGRGIFDSETQDAKVFGDEAGDRLTKNRNAQVILQGYERSADRISQTFVNWFKSKNDPRLALYAETSTGAPANASSIGMPNGYDLGGVKSIETAPGYPGTLDGYVQNATKTIQFNSPTFFMTAAEAQLLAADAVQRGFVGGDANAYFKKGVNLAIRSFAYYGIAGTQAAADTYTATLNLTPGAELQDINEQIWATCGGTYNFYESYANWRRTGFPALIPTVYPTSVIGAVIPRRFTYPIAEQSVNLANYNAAVAALPGGDVLTSRVWWDK
ncbi:SusD/RagB family nutrient-binding outer membrane lipoprotein [Solitalea koreensis]|uniref:Starch-binding associating with outer membrane n=1 Tax=Solitalea koreensis TaxID=543615 RepID=A0A521C9F4_9SPHI|nr:SusD/RagB family nutrient-binding outer membrane lipoprotein [Solitalea koreensis]SMO55340.1 Starch-binding associating with outer membrane [Solitalea koreensis]